MKIFITGGTGFIGRNLKEQLNDTYNIIAPQNSELDLLNQYQVFEFLKSHKFDLVIHTATWNATRNSPKDTTKVLENNLRMFFNLARISNLYGKMIYFGSGAEYDRAHWIPKMPEDYFDTHIPTDDYGFSKYIMTKYAQNTDNIYNLRLFGVFGKYEDWEIRFISNACCKAVCDLPITIKQNVYFDYLYIDDLVNLTKWFIENSPGETTNNVCTGKTFDLLTLAKKILKISGKNLDIIIENDGLGKEYSGDNSKLLQALKAYEFAEIGGAIEKLYDWYAANKDIIVDKNRLLVNK